MRLYNHLNEKASISKFLKGIKNLTYSKAKKKFKNAGNQFKNEIQKYPELENKILELINKEINTNFSSFKEIDKLKESDDKLLNEDFKHFWMGFKDQGWPAITIFPALQIGFEMDTLLEGAGLGDLNFKKIAVYGLIWISLVTGKHIKQGKRGKKENPKEYEKEGEPGPFSVSKGEGT